MPIYTYKRADGTVFEHVQSMSEDALTECPVTGQACTRIPSRPSRPVLKGKGFHATDYNAPTRG